MEAELKVGEVWGVQVEVGERGGEYGERVKRQKGEGKGRKEGEEDKEGDNERGRGEKKEREEDKEGDNGREEGEGERQGGR